MSSGKIEITLDLILKLLLLVALTKFIFLY